MKPKGKGELKVLITIALILSIISMIIFIIATVWSLGYSIIMTRKFKNLLTFGDKEDEAKSA
jgi:hypothetical protein